MLTTGKILAENGQNQIDSQNDSFIKRYQIYIPALASVGISYYITKSVLKKSTTKSIISSIGVGVLVLYAPLIFTKKAWG